MEWKPISEAPKDGTWISAFDGHNVIPMRWEQDEDDDDHVGWCVAGSWYGGILFSQHYVPDREPSHWMPLPPPPESDQ